MNTQPKMTIYETAINASRISKEKHIRKCAGRFKKKNLSLGLETKNSDAAALEYLKQELSQMTLKRENTSVKHHNTFQNEIISENIFNAGMEIETKELVQIGINTSEENETEIKYLTLIQENQISINYTMLREVGLVVHGHWIDESMREDSHKQIILEQQEGEEEQQIFCEQNDGEQEVSQLGPQKIVEEEVKLSKQQSNLVKKKKEIVEKDEEFNPKSIKQTCKRTKIKKYQKQMFLVEHRQKQYNTIKKYIQKELKAQIQLKKQPLVIFGTPGTGKTACVRRVLADLNLKVKVIEINVISAKNWYKVILNAYGIRCNQKNAISIFGLMPGSMTQQTKLKVQKMLNTPKVIFFDEIDMGFTQQDVYNIWDLSKTTRTCVIMAGNFSGFMEKMESKIHSRYLQPPLIFPPYSLQIIKNILRVIFPECDQELIKYSVIKYGDSFDLRVHINRILLLKKNKTITNNRGQLFKKIDTLKQLTSTQMIQSVCQDLMSLFILKSAQREQVTHLFQLFNFTGMRIPLRYIMYTLQNLIDMGLVSSKQQIVPSNYGRIWIYSNTILDITPLPQLNILDLLENYDEYQKERLDRKKALGLI